MTMTNDNEIRLMEQRRDNFKEKYKLYPNYAERYDSDRYGTYRSPNEYFFKGTLRDADKIPGIILFDILEVKQKLNYEINRFIREVFPDEEFYLKNENELMIKGNEDENDRDTH